MGEHGAPWHSSPVRRMFSLQSIPDRRHNRAESVIDMASGIWSPSRTGETENYGVSDEPDEHGLVAYRTVDVNLLHSGRQGKEQGTFCLSQTLELFQI